MNLRPILLVALACLLGLLGGCGATRHPEAGVPGDFALAITVLRETAGRDVPRALRPAQYMVDVDGTLRVAVGPGVGPTTYPPRMRRLSPAQVARLWSLSESAGLAEFPHPARLDDIRAFRPTPRDGWAIVDIAGGGQRQAIAIELAAAPGVVTLTDELAGLAWIRP